MMTCRDVRTRIDDFIDGELSAEADQAFREHLDDCVACDVRVKRAEAFSQQLARLAATEPDEARMDAVLNRFWNGNEQRQARPGGSGPTRRPHLRRFSTAAALVLGVVVGSFFLPGEDAAEPRDHQLALQVGETGEMTVSIDSRNTVEHAQLTLLVPPDFRIEGFTNRRISWTTRLEPGVNLLRLPVRALRPDTKGSMTVRVSTDEGVINESRIELSATNASSGGSRG